MVWKLTRKQKKRLRSASASAWKGTKVVGAGVFKGGRYAFNKMADVGEGLQRIEAAKKKTQKKKKKYDPKDDMEFLSGLGGF